MKKKIYKTEMCSNGDTNEKELLIRLGTKSEKVAEKRASSLIKQFNGLLTIKKRKDR